MISIRERVSLVASRTVFILDLFYSSSYNSVACLINYPVYSMKQNKSVMLNKLKLKRIKDYISNKIVMQFFYKYVNRNGCLCSHFWWMQQHGIHSMDCRIVVFNKGQYLDVLIYFFSIIPTARTIYKNPHSNLGGTGRLRRKRGRRRRKKK